MKHCNQPPLEIVYVGQLPPHPGGSAIMPRVLLDALAVDGHRLRAISTMTPEARQSNAFVNPERGDVAVTWFEMPYFERGLTPAPLEYRKRQTELVLNALTRLTRERSPDVILVGRSQILFGIGEFGSAHGIPVVLWQQVSYEVDKRLDEKFFGGARFKEMVKLARVIPCARHMVPDFISAGLPRVTAITNGVDTTRFHPALKDRDLVARLGLDTPQQVAVHTSNLHEIKRPMDIVACANALRRRCPHLLWLIVGHGPCREEMLTEARRLGIEGRFRFVGWTDHRDVAPYLQLADFAVMPSEDECLPLAYLEAMACGVPVIASDIAAAREVIRDGVTGLLHHTGDIDNMAEQVALLVEQPERQQIMGAAARDSITNNFDIRDTARRFVDLFREEIESEVSART